MIYQIEIQLKKDFRDRHGEHLRHDISDIGIKNPPNVKYSSVYKIEGDTDEKEIDKIASKLLVDPVTETYSVIRIEIRKAAKRKKSPGQNKCGIEVWFKPGVTDTVSESVVKAVRDLGIDKELKVKTGRKFVFEGNISTKNLKQIAERLLVNPMIQEYRIME